MRVLVKLGGTLLDSDETRVRLAAEIAEAAKSHEVVVVHGGGKQMTKFLAERGVESKFVNGLRVTTPDVIDAVMKVFAGSVNASAVTALRAAGAMPVGLSGISAGLVDAEILNPELGFVGKPTQSNPRLLQVLTGAKLLPVVACVAGDAAGNIYNVNADQMAVACAAAYRAEKLLFLTDVNGVKDGAGNVRTSLTRAEARQLIADGVATGGMQAKLESSIAALDGGVPEVRIAPGAKVGIVAELLAGAATGTALVP